MNGGRAGDSGFSDPGSYASLTLALLQKHLAYLQQSSSYYRKLLFSSQLFADLSIYWAD